MFQLTFFPCAVPCFSLGNDGEDEEEGGDDDAYGAVAVIRVTLFCEVRRRESPRHPASRAHADDAQGVPSPTRNLRVNAFISGGGF